MPQPSHIYASSLSRRESRRRRMRTPHPHGGRLGRRTTPQAWRLIGVAAGTAVMVEALSRLAL